MPAIGVHAEVRHAAACRRLSIALTMPMCGRFLARVGLDSEALAA